MMKTKKLLIGNLIFFSLTVPQAFADDCERMIELQENLQKYSQELIELKNEKLNAKNRFENTILARNSLNLSILELVNIAEAGGCGATVTQKGSDALILYGEKLSAKNNIHRDIFKMQNGEFSNTWKRYSLNRQETVFEL